MGCPDKFQFEDMVKETTFSFSTQNIYHIHLFIYDTRTHTKKKNPCKNMSLELTVTTACVTE